MNGVFKVGDKVMIAATVVSLPEKRATGRMCINVGVGHTETWLPVDSVVLAHKAKAQVLRDAADLLAAEEFRAAASVCRELADNIDPPRVDVVEVLKDVAHYLQNCGPHQAQKYADLLLAASRQIEAEKKD
jgi:acyl-CoA hydrolase